MRRRRLPLCLLAALALALAPTPGPAEETRRFRVVVHPDNEREEITPQLLSDLFLKRVTRWEDGDSVQPVDLAERSPVRDAFSRAVHQRRTAAIKSYWQKMIFSGTATPPPEVDGDAEVLAFVRSRPGAIGYVSAALPAERLDGVKPLPLVDERRADETTAGGDRSPVPLPS